MLGYPGPEADPTDSSLEQQIDMAKMRGTNCIFPRSPGTHIVRPWVTGNIELCRDLRTGTQYKGSWASRVCSNRLGTTITLVRLQGMGKCKGHLRVSSPLSR